MRNASGESALEQGWLLREMRDRFGFSIEELARRFDRNPSWVSRRLGLVSRLPEAIQEEVRRGRLVAHAAMKYLLPLARANPEGAQALAAAIAPLSPSSRQTQALCTAFARGDEEARSYLLEHPEMYLRAHGMSTSRSTSQAKNCPIDQLRDALVGLSQISHRGSEQLASVAASGLTPPERQEIIRHWQMARTDVACFLQSIEREFNDARRTDPNDHSQAL